MKKRLILLFLIAGWIAPATIFAQKVYIDASNRLILDLTEEAGMPPGAMTSESKTVRYADFSPSNDGGFPTTDNSTDGILNKKVYRKLEIAPHDISSAPGTKMDWKSAFEACRENTYDNGGWRLPIQRELMLISIFRPALDALLPSLPGGGMTFSSVIYWSATEYSYVSNRSWGVNFNAVGQVTHFDKVISDNTTYLVRCVREVTD